jgi:hypothetical protein
MNCKNLILQFSLANEQSTYGGFSHIHDMEKCEIIICYFNNVIICENNSPLRKCRTF